MHYDQVVREGNWVVAKLALNSTWVDPQLLPAGSLHFVISSTRMFDYGPCSSLPAIGPCVGLGCRASLSMQYVLQASP
jgi:hypothetical protein